MLIIRFCHKITTSADFHYVCMWKGIHTCTYCNFIRYMRWNRLKVVFFRERLIWKSNFSLIFSKYLTSVLFVTGAVWKLLFRTTSLFTTNTIWTVSEAFYFPTWTWVTVSALWAYGEQTVSGIWWTQMNGVRLANAERKRSAKWMMNARWTICKRFVNARWMVYSECLGSYPFFVFGPQSG